MLRQFFLFLSRRPELKDWALQFAVFRNVAHRFVAGETLEEALQAVRHLNAQDIRGMLNYLGEHARTPEDTKQATETYCRIFDEIDRAGVDSNVSVKPTQLGLHFEEELLYENLRRIVEHAARFQNTVEIDMEDSACTQRTLDVYFRLREAGYDNVGAVIQAYLYRSEEDIERLIEYEAKVRLVKGAYDEPAEIAYRKKEDINRNFLRLMEKLFSPEARDYGVMPAIATHDDRLIDAAKELAQKNGWSREAFEFQMLYGVREELQKRLVQEGYQVRVYVPYGSEWYPYFMRRIAERPANVVFVLRAILSRG